MSDNKRFDLDKQQKFLRGLVFLSAGVFLLIQFTAGDSPDPYLLTLSWVAAGVAFGAMVAFIWSMRPKK